MVGRASEVRCPRGWVARWGCDQWQLEVIGSCGKHLLWGWVQLQRQQRHLWRLLLCEPTAPVGDLGQTWSPLTSQRCCDVSLLTSLFYSLRGTRGEKAGRGPGEEHTYWLPQALPLHLTDFLSSVLTDSSSEPPETAQRPRGLRQSACLLASTPASM